MTRPSLSGAAGAARDPRHLAIIAISLLFFAVFLASSRPWAVPTPPVLPAGQASAGLDGFPGFPVDLNRAGVDELAALPGIGPVTASRIVAERERLGRFSAVDDLVRVRWMTPARVEKLRALVAVSAPPSSSPADTGGAGLSQAP